MNYKNISFLIESDNSWKQLFLTGQKGLPKTNIDTLDYIERLLADLYDGDPIKIEKSKIKIWLVKIINKIGGIDEIGMDELAEIKKTLEWYKATSNYDQIKDLDLASSYNIAIKYFDKKEKDSKLSNTKDSSLKNEEEIELLQDEKDGKIQRLYVLPDGTRRMWIKVLNPSWFSEKCFRGKMKGVKCQATSNGKYAKPPYESYTLIGPDKSDLNSAYSTLGSISILNTEKSIAELKQEGNQHPGSQSTSTGWDDLGEQFLKFICFSNEMKTKINKFSSDAGVVGDVGDEDTYGGTATFNWWMNNKPEYINFLAKHRFDIISNNKVNIIRNRNFGEKWFTLREVDLNKLVKDNPLEIILKIETFSKIFGKQLSDALKNINLIDLGSKNKDIFYNNLPTITEFVDNNMVFNILDAIYYLNLNKNLTNFENSIRIVSNRKGKDLIKKLVDRDFNLLVNKYGKKGSGLNSLLEFLSTPQSNETFLKSKKIGPKRYESYRVENNNNNTKKINFEVDDDKKILTQKDRRDIIKNHKSEIESWYYGDKNENPEMEFLRLLFTEYNVQDIKRESEDKKYEFIDYYDMKYNIYKSEKNNKIKSTSQNKPGILEFYSIVSKYDKNYKNSNITTSDYTISDAIYQLELDDFKKYYPEILKYYKDDSKFANSSSLAKDYATRVYYAFKALILTAELSGFDKNIIYNIILKAKPNLFFKNNIQYINANSYKLYADKLLLHYFENDKNQVKKFIEDMKDEIEETPNGKKVYEDIKNSYSSEGYNIQIGDMIQYKADDDKAEGLNHMQMYKIVDLENDKIKDKEVINGKIYIINNRGEKTLVHPSQFKGVIKQTMNENNEILLNYIREKIKKKYDNALIKENKKHSVSYSGIILDRDSKNKLLKIFDFVKDEYNIENTERWNISADHVTISLGEIYDKSLLDETVILTLKSVAYNERILAFGVETDVNIDFKSKIPHITVVFNKEAGAKPVESNYLKNWQELPKEFQIELFGTIMEKYHQ
jgi:hypothetical protein